MELPWLDTSKSANWEDGPPESIGTELLTTDWIIGMMPDEWNRNIQNEQIMNKKANGTLTAALSSTGDADETGDDDDDDDDDDDNNFDDNFDNFDDNNNFDDNFDNFDEEMKNTSNSDYHPGQQRLDYQEIRQLLQNRKLSTDQLTRIKELVVNKLEQRQTHIRKKRRLN